MSAHRAQDDHHDTHETACVSQDSYQVEPGPLDPHSLLVPAEDQLGVGLLLKVQVASVVLAGALKPPGHALEVAGDPPVHQFHLVILDLVKIQVLRVGKQVVIDEVQVGLDRVFVELESVQELVHDQQPVAGRGHEVVYFLLGLARFVLVRILLVQVLLVARVKVNLNIGSQLTEEEANDLRLVIEGTDEGNAEVELPLEALLALEPVVRAGTLGHLSLVLGELGPAPLQVSLVVAHVQVEVVVGGRVGGVRVEQRDREVVVLLCQYNLIGVLHQIEHGSGGLDGRILVVDVHEGDDEVAEGDGEVSQGEEGTDLGLVGLRTVVVEGDGNAEGVEGLELLGDEVSRLLLTHFWIYFYH